MRAALVCALAAACGLAASPAAAAEAVRVMAFGDSLTKGTGSTHGAGYRLSYVQKLTEAGVAVDMLGTFHNGPKEIDRDHQGHQGQGVAKLDEVSFDELRRERPEVVILMIGTNDARDTLVPDAFRIRYSVLLDRILAESRTKLVAATIPPARYGKRDKTMAAINGIIRDEVEKRASAGKPVRLVEVNEMIDRRADFVDALHLNDEAYARVGAAFAEATLDLLRQHPAQAAAP